MKQNKIKKRNPVVLEMLEMKGQGKHIKSNKAIRKQQNKKVKDSLVDDLYDYIMGHDW